MSGHLPGTRNVLSSTYIDDLVDEKPVEKPDTELPADPFNKMKGDLAYAARMVPLLRIQISNNGTASVAAVSGPESVVTGNVTASRTAQGRVTVDWTATGVIASDAHGASRHASTFSMFLTRNLTTTSIEVATLTNVGADLDTNFTLWVY